MSTQEAARVPEVTLGWRLKMSLGELSAQEMADQLGVSRQTLSRWMADKGAPPKRAYLAQWAFKTDVPLVWLETGIAPSGDPQGGGTVSESSVLDSGDPTTTQEYVPHLVAA
jgi:transcriptional regulator with XRE-family HTH domain